LRRRNDAGIAAADNGCVKKPSLPLRPAHPERICWGCDRYCPVDDLGCANGSIRTPHPCELFGDDWLDWSLDGPSPPDSRTDTTPRPLTTPRRVD
jgi:hypothetical protein